MEAPTVLLIEDNEDSRSIYRLILELSGYRVLVASDGEEGIRRAREERPALILMDISLPKIDGWQATLILKAEEETRQIPIIALTAHALASDRARSQEVGCDGFLTKPVEPRRVLEEVRRWVIPGAPLA